MQRSPVELIQTSERGSVGHEGEDTLVLGRGRSVVEGRATILVATVDVGEANHVQNHINTLNVTAVGGESKRNIQYACQNEHVHVYDTSLVTEI